MLGCRGSMTTNISSLALASTSELQVYFDAGVGRQPVR